jgi:endonuclease/exonuclease/phosphatase family metal-dependent hydrolase
MQLNIAVYNMEWMLRLFDSRGQLKTDSDSLQRAEDLAEVVRAIGPDLLGVVEGPDTTASGTRNAARQLEVWARHFGLDPAYRAVTGFVSRGRQELCALYRSDRIKVSHKPVRARARTPFNEPFICQTEESLVKELYEHYRPPLELSVSDLQGKELMRVLVAHAKSKGIFDRVDFGRYERLSERNRKKLFAECLSMRKRCDQWLEEAPERGVLVMGDINDGFGQDYYEQRFSRSAVELLLGDVWHPERILKSVLGDKPRLGKYGWTPATSRFTDTVTGDTLNVLIDHILVSRSVAVKDVVVWNPYLEHEPEARARQIRALKNRLRQASDHYPVSAVIEV